MRSSRSRAPAHPLAVALSGVAALAGALFATPAYAQRLPGSVVPSHYSLTLTPDLAAATFTGQVDIDVTVKAPTTTVVVNALDLKISKADVRQGSVTSPAEVVLDDTQQQATLTVPKALQPGEARLRLEFTGVLNDQLAGFYLSKTEKRRYAVTQFEATDARRAFPCFDEPALKATFDITAVVDVGDVAISNGRMTSDRPGPVAGKHTVTFARTTRLPTYLLALLVGDFECTDGTVDAVPLRVCGTAGRRDLTRYALEVTKAVVSYYNQYYSTPFPFPKLDQVAVPDFMAGAMENAGAIVYRDTALLLDERTATPDERRGVAGVIAHEIAHQWFGDLVTMDWWNNVWLNEGFATWMSSKPLAAWKPEWKMHLRDVQGTVYSLKEDSVASTRAIQATQANTPAEIIQLFDGISYGKAASVLRMVEQYIGESAFRSGVNAYLEGHAWGNATSEDFWSSLTRASGKPAGEIMASFVRQPGAPLLTVSTTCEGGRRRVDVAQQRFFADPARLRAGSPERWAIPVCFRAPKGIAQCELITQPRQTIFLEGCAPWTYANADGRGYYRTEYIDGSADALARAAADLTPGERITFLKDQWELVSVDRQSVPGYLDLVAALGVEREEAVTQVAWEPLEFIGEEIVAPADRQAYQRWVRDLLRSQLEALGRTGQADDTDATRKIRARALARLAVVAHDTETIAQLKLLADRYLADPESVDPSLVDVAVDAAATFGDAAFHDRMIKALVQSTRPDVRARLDYALAGFAAPELLERTLQRALTPDVRNQDLLYILFTALRHRETRPQVWAFIKAHFDQIQARTGSLAATAIVGVVNSFCDATLRDDARAFFMAHPQQGAEATLQQGLERADSCIGLAQQERSRVHQWLQRSARPTGPQ